jgi:hypothetical protein
MWIHISKNYRCSRVLAEVCSGLHICLGGKRSATSSATTMRAKSYKPESPTGICMTPRSGQTCEPLTPTLGEAASTSSALGFHANHLAYQARWEQGSTSETGGPTPPELFATFDLGTSSWKTSQACLLALMGILAPYSATWPRSGIMSNGRCYLRRTAARRISAAESGLKLPTPTATQYGSNRSQSDGAAVRPSLAQIAKTFPTPTAHNAKEGAYPSEYNRNEPTLATHAGGKLNPEWVEWLMGWPIGWTDLKPLETDRFRLWLQQHGRL